MNKKIISLMTVFIMMLQLISANIFSVSAAYVSSSSLTVTSQKEYKLYDGMTETKLVMKNKSGEGVVGHIVEIKPGAPVSAKVSYPGYYAKNSTEASRAAFAENPVWARKTTTGQAKDYTTATGQKVLYATNTDSVKGETTDEYSDGQPSGCLVMEGNIIQTTELAYRPYFAVLKDGTFAIRDIGTTMTDVAEATAGRKYLVKDGKNVVTQEDSDVLGQQPFNSIGLKADGTLITFLADGRRDDSVGCTEIEMADYLVSQGVKDALMLDGGGSATIATMRAGESSLTLRNQPRDSASSPVTERAIGPSLMFIPSDRELFFDFGNTTTDQQRYSHYTYGGTNFDTKSSWVPTIGTSDTISVNNTSGTLSLKKATSNNPTYFYATTGSDLQFRPDFADYLQIRMRITGFDAASASSYFSFNYYADGSSTQNTNAALHYFGNGYKFDGSSILLTLPIEQKFRNAEFIDKIRLSFMNLSGTGTVEIDYIYIGPQNSLPEQDHLIFDFQNTPTDARRYNSKTYSYRNFDIGSWAYNSKKSSQPSIKNGTLSFNIAQTTDNYASSGYSPYIQPSDDTNGMVPILNYAPGEDDYLQIRFKMQSCAAISGKTPYMFFHFATGDSIDPTNPYAGNVYYELSASEMTSGKYNVVTIPLSSLAAYKNADRMNLFRLVFHDVRSADNATGKIEIDYIYVGSKNSLPEQDHLYFDFQNTLADKNRYDSKTYAYQNYDIGSWGYNQKKSTVPEFDGENISFQIPQTTDDYLTSGQSPYIQPVGSDKNLTKTILDYTPGKEDYFQIRFKIEDCDVMPDKGAFLRLHYEADESIDFTNNVMKRLSLNELDSSEYQVVTLPLYAETAYQEASKILSFRLLFHNVRSAEGKTGKITVDYIYIGSKESLPQQDHLFFDFSNTDEDRSRYANKTYGFQNYDVDGWIYNDKKSTKPSISNGVLNFNIAETTDNYATSGCSPFIQTSDASGDILPILNYTPGAEDYLQIRFKMQSCAAVSGKNPLMYFYFATGDSTDYSGNVKYDLTASEMTSGKYIVATIPLSTLDAYKNADRMNLFRLVFHNVRSTDGETGQISIDYIYVGGKDTLPQQDYLYFDFQNTPKDEIRYNTKMYSYQNYDIGFWSYGSNKSTEPVFDGENISFKIAETTDNYATSGCSPYIQTSDASGGMVPILNYTPGAEDYLQIRFKMQSCVALSGSTPVLRLYFATGDSTSYAGNVMYNLTTSEMTSGQYITATIPMSSLDAYKNADRINLLRLVFQNVRSADGETGQIEIDYMYLGSKEALPLQDYLYFGFENTPADINRYNTKTYSYQNYDAGSWGYNPNRGTAPVFDGENLCFQVTETTDNYGSTGHSPYIHTTDMTGDLTLAILNYTPGSDDYLQIRFKMQSCAAVAGKNPAMRFYYATEDSTEYADNVIYYLTDSDMTSGQYITATIPLSSRAAYKNAQRMNLFHVVFQNVRSADNETGQVAIDYIYVGGKSGLPTSQYTVKFLNWDGTLLKEQIVYKGESAVYTGANPAKPYNANYHYTFKGWDKALTNITANTNITATYTETAHSYKTTVTPPTCTEQGYTTYTCSLCEYSYQSNPVKETGHTEVIDKAVAPTYTDPGLTQGSHCSVCNEVIVKQQIVAATGNNLLFSFNNTDADQRRYSSQTYGFQNYDRGSWGYSNAKSSKPSISGGNLNFNIAETTDNYASTGHSPFIQTSNANGGTVPILNYAPGAEDYLQIRFKMQSCTAVADKNPVLRLYFATGESTEYAGNVMYNLTTSDMTSGQYVVATIPLSSLNAYKDADRVNLLRLIFQNVRSADGETGQISIDYIYIGAKAGLPNSQYTVNFLNWNGELLKKQTVYAGESAVYSGANPERPYDANYHYTFKGWDKALTNITADTNITAIYEKTSHTDDTSVVSQKPTWDASGYTSYICECGATKATEAIIVAKVGNVSYKILSEAFAAAGNGETISLQYDFTVPCDILYINDGVTLDLNGHILAANYLVGFAGSAVIDGSDANTGKLVALQDRVVLDAENAGYMPVYDGDGYVFSTLSIKAAFNTNDASLYQFLPKFESVANAPLAEGAESSGTKILVRLSWMDNSYTAIQNFVYTDDFVRRVMTSFNTTVPNNYASAFKAIFKRTDADVTDFTVTAVVISETGVEMESQPLTLKTNN